MGEGVKNPIVCLQPWEYERGFAVGIARYTANWSVADAKHYDRSRMEEDRKASSAAAICELAVAKYTNSYWHGHIWHRSDHRRYSRLPDVGAVIEVRRVRTKDAVAVRRTDAGREVWAARINDPEYRSVEILGFVMADEAIANFREGEDWGYFPISRLTRPWMAEVAQ